MFPRRRAIAACVALTLVGLCGLFLYAQSITPRPLAIAEIGGDDIGVPVRVRGHVHRIWTQDDGDATFVLLDYASLETVRITARAQSIAQPTLVAPGALVEVVGTVFRSGATIQIFCNEADAVKVIVPSDSNRLSLEFLAKNAARLAGEEVVVRAVLAEARTVTDFRHALLRADGGEVWAYRPGGWTEGQKDITGRLVLTSRGRCELFAGEEPDAIEAPATELARCPDTLLGRPVMLRNAKIVPGELLGTSLALRDHGDDVQFRMAGFVEKWDWREDNEPLRIGDLVSLSGVVEFHASEARWRISAKAPPWR